MQRICKRQKYVHAYYPNHVDELLRLLADKTHKLENVHL